MLYILTKKQVFFDSVVRGEKQTTTLGRYQMTTLGEETKQLSELSAVGPEIEKLLDM